MRIVLDTNVLVAALLSPYRAPAQVLQLLLTGRAKLCYDVRILSEYREVLARPKFAFAPESVAELLMYLEEGGELVAATPVNMPLPDPGDRMFLEVALAGRADHLVTGNLRHFPANTRRGISVISPAEFVRGLDQT